MLKGVVSVIIFYAIGLGLTGFTYLVFGAGLGHGPGPYIAIPFLTYVIGIVWTVIALFQYFVEGGKTDRRKGVIYANIVAVIILTSMLLYFRSQSPFNTTKFNDDNISDQTSLYR
jgi:hypothetical protein